MIKIFEDLSQINPDGSISLIRNIDTFEVVLNLLVVDTSAPVFITSFCDTCASFPFEVGITDCDTSWITSFDSVQMANGVVEYNWYGQDRCGNFSVYTIVKDLSVEPTLYFEDLDQDGFGNSDRTFLWSGVIPGIATRGGDCDDQNPDRFPGNEDDPFDNFDNDCEGTGHHETCNLSEQIRVSSSCQFQTFQVYESFLEYMDNTCTSLFDLWDGDLWFRIDPGNAQDFNLEIDLDDPISALNVYQGTCEALELIACSEYGDSTLTVSGYSSNETLMLQVALSNIYEGSLGICTQSNSLTSSLHEVDPIPIRVYPNPVLDQQRLEFELTRPALVEVQIVNALGQIIDQEDPVLFDVGYHQMFLDFGNIPAGTYWIIVNHDGFRSSMKSIKF